MPKDDLPHAWTVPLRIENLQGMSCLHPTCMKTLSTCANAEAHTDV